MSAHEGGEPTLLLVDDDDAFRGVMSAALARRGFAVTEADNAARAEVEAQKKLFEYALVDVRMPGQGGIGLVAALRRIERHGDAVARSRAEAVHRERRGEAGAAL